MLGTETEAGYWTQDKRTSTIPHLVIIDCIKLILCREIVVNAECGEVTGQQTLYILDVSDSSIRGVYWSRRVRPRVETKNVESYGVQQALRDGDETPSGSHYHSVVIQLLLSQQRQHRSGYGGLARVTDGYEISR